ncbi:D-lyxose/D-mannose family sugar isomerase [Bacillus sp. FJAT-27264]|uniref:D-lyxose/D-mannose family sugar isomerase n=1 Tax=Paenibacillus sp. (strain DSM 101736 / FJAT-27264) TaxID=1850362 RepID=UPI000807F46F|nr:D-lyxose/D-mannose family sugar isomerase [Bacillus sp. FJAT-27264]OBZ14977.1 D-lyxose/D-mannose family sugar isomerase [Bacillus sp. FJAT-27264]
MQKEVYEQFKPLILAYFDKAHIVLTEQEKEQVEIADFGLGDLTEVGLSLITLINTERCCAKEMVLLPGQTCPEHLHPAIPELNYPGKEETFRCRSGSVYLYVEGEPSPQIAGELPEIGKAYYTVFHEIVLKEGEQYTIHPHTRHWFQGGPQGAVVSEFSTKSLDEYDIFTDPNIDRIPRIEG